MIIIENTYKIFDNQVEQKLIKLFGKKYKDYREAWNVAGSKNAPDFPIYLDMEFFDICSQKCTFCPRNETIHKNLPYKINTKIKIDCTKTSETNYTDKQWNCIHPFRRLSVISDGSILPCCSFWGRALKIGNIDNISLKDAWNSEKLNKIRNDLIEDKSSVCSTCQSN
jgi:radical SAM protein with 4Fe4S-binding SPASM domain